MQKNIPFILTGVTALVGLGLQFSVLGEWAILAWCAAALFFSVGVCLYTLRLGISVTAAICALANGYLLNLKLNPPQGSALCTINTTIDCVSINNSDYSVVFAGTGWEAPITLLGLGFFTALALAALMGAKTAPRLFQVTTLFAMFNVLVSLYLLTALISEKTFCIFCVSIYLGNLIILVAALAGMKQAQQTLFGSFDKALFSKSMLVVAGGFALIVTGSLATGFTGDRAVVVDVDTPAGEIDVMRVAELYTAPAGPLELDGTEPVMGPEDAPYTIVEFADYGCPHCADAAAEFKRILKRQKDIQLRFKVFPLAGDCNPAFEDTGRVGPCIAAAAAECAYRQGAFWEVNADLFSNQRALAESQWNLNDLNFIARSHGLDVSAFEACIRNASTMEGIYSDAASGNKLNLKATPTFLLKGATGDKWALLKEPKVAHLLTIINAHRKGAKLPDPN